MPSNLQKWWSLGASGEAPPAPTVPDDVACWAAPEPQLKRDRYAGYTSRFYEANIEPIVIVVPGLDYFPAIQFSYTPFPERLEAVTYGGPLHGIGDGSSPTTFDLIADSFGNSSQTVSDPNTDTLTAVTDGVNDSTFSFTSATHDEDFSWKGVVNEGEYTSTGTELEMEAQNVSEATIVKLDATFAGMSEVYACGMADRITGGDGTMLGFELSDGNFLFYVADWNDDEAAIYEFDSGGSLTAVRAGPSSTAEINPLEMTIEFSGGTFKTPYHTYVPGGGVTVTNVALGVYYIGNGTMHWDYMWVATEEPSAFWPIS